MNVNDIHLAALLHDIGKFAQRAIDHRRAHQEFSAEFVSELGLGTEVQDLVLNHHNPKNSRFEEEARIIQMGDHHSAKERKKCEKKEHVTRVPLISIFSEIRLDKNGKDLQHYYLPLKSIEAENLNDIKPKQHKREITKKDYEDLWESFKREISNLTNIDPTTLYYLLKKYTSLIPSAVYKSVPDISLFDHLKTTAALAVCLYNHKQEGGYIDERPYLVVYGDISGIQDFIYKIASPEEAQKGMSKRLRGRSLYLTLLIDAIANKIIKNLDLPITNILFCGGGHFTLILPNTKKAHEVVDDITRKVNKYFIDVFNAELYLSINKKECSSSEIKDFGLIIKELEILNLQKKRSKFRENLDDVFKVKEENVEATCIVCGIPTSNKICKFCKSHERLGERVAKADYMIKVFSSVSGADFSEVGISYFFEKKENLIKRIKKLSGHEKVEILKLNDSNFLESESETSSENISHGFICIGNTVPMDDEITLDFDHLAAISKGSNKLAALKMDVDHLGKIFKEGLKDRSISRLSTLSSFLDLFFMGYINNIAKSFSVLRKACEDCKGEAIKVKISEHSTKKFYRTRSDICRECEKYRLPTIYITYSGGDDLLVFGPYDDIIQFAGKLRREFKEWTCENPHINISGGIFIGSPKFPVGRAASEAENYLELSKEKRNRITVLNETIPWDSKGEFKGFYERLKFGEKLEELYEKGKISRRFVYSMLILQREMIPDSIETFKEALKSEEKIQIKSYVPYFAYKLRNIKDSSLREKLFNYGLEFMPWIKLPVSWVILRTRRE